MGREPYDSGHAGERNPETIQCVLFTAIKFMGSHNYVYKLKC